MPARAVPQESPTLSDAGTPSQRFPWEVISGPSGRSIVLVSFDGAYAPGSQGNGFARLMKNHLDSILANTNAAGVVIDFTNLQYTWGDAIATLAMSLMRYETVSVGESPRIIGVRPAAVVATGPTAKALRPLFAANFLFAIAGVELAGTRAAAIAHVERALSTAPR
jgi:hypothetical protein